MRRACRPLLVMSAAFAACGGDATGKMDGPRPAQAPEIGLGDHSPSSVQLTLIAERAAGLRTPRDLAFNPLRRDELWIVNRGDDSVVIIHQAPSDARTTERRKDGYALHFMARPSSIAFGAAETTIGKPGTFATCQESRNTYDDQAPPNDFMGPALWSSDLETFAKKNPNGLGSHLDMLHESPNCMGIAWQEKNVYWVFGGRRRDIVRYDFQVDDGIGNDDHSDGAIRHYVAGEVTMKAGVPSHMVYRPEDKMLYIADTGNGHVVKLDTTSGTFAREINSIEPAVLREVYIDATLTEVVPSSDDLSVPSGLEVKGDLLFVSDNEKGRISAYTLDGVRVNYLDTGLPKGALMGMALGPDGKLYLVDAVGERVLRIDVPPMAGAGG